MPATFSAEKILFAAVIAGSIFLQSQFAPAILAADKPAVKSFVDRAEIGADETLRYTIQVEGAEEIRPPDDNTIGDFEVVGRSSSSSISIVNTKITSTKQFVYVLSPRKEGDLEIPAIKFMVDNGTMSTEPVKVKVVAAGSGPSRQGGQPPPAGSPKFPSGPGTMLPGFDPFADFFQKPRAAVPREQDAYSLEAVAEKRSAYVNEPLAFSIIFRRAPSASIWGNPDYDQPSFTGFRAERQGESQPRPVTVNGREYIEQEIRYVLYPLSPGELEIGAARVVIQPDPFSDKVVLRTKPVVVTVNPLPEDGKPDGYAGLVGRNIRVTAEVDRSAPPADTSAIFTVTAEGEGNLRDMKEIPFEKPASVEFYPPEVDESQTPVGGKPVWKKRYKYIIVPRAEGKVSIGPVRLPYLDTDSGKYRSAESPAVLLDVGKSTGQATGPAAMQGRAADRPRLAPLRGLPSAIEDHSRPPYADPLRVALVILPLAVVMAEYARRRYMGYLNRDPEGRRRSRAARTAFEKLDSIAKLKNPDAREIHAEFDRIVRGYLSDKLSIPAPAMTAANVGGILAQTWPKAEPHAGELKSLLETLDFARFAPVESDPNGISRLDERIRHLITDLEKNA